MEGRHPRQCGGWQGAVPAAPCSRRAPARARAYARLLALGVCHIHVWASFTAAFSCITLHVTGTSGVNESLQMRTSSAGRHQVLADHHRRRQLSMHSTGCSCEPPLPLRLHTELRCSSTTIPCRLRSPPSCRLHTVSIDLPSTTRSGILGIAAGAKYGRYWGESHKKLRCEVMGGGGTCQRGGQALSTGAAKARRSCCRGKGPGGSSARRGSFGGRWVWGGRCAGP